MVFEALSQYEIDIPTHKDLNLDISIQLPGRDEPIRYRIDYGSALLSKTAEVRYF